LILDTTILHLTLKFRIFKRIVNSTVKKKEEKGFMIYNMIILGRRYAITYKFGSGGL
jgi:hypothetical protein